MTLPQQFLKNMEGLLTEQEYQAYLDSFSQKRLYGLRVNTSKISVEDFLRICPFKLTPISFCREGFYYDGEIDRPAKHPYYFAGLYYLQEPSAMYPATLLDVKANEIVLDGCAAPGGKSSQLLAKMDESAFLVSNDISPSRCMGLLKNLTLTGRDNYCVISQDLVTLSQRYQNCFDKILLDAPCSGEGMFRKDSSLINQWHPDINSYYQKKQTEIMDAALKMLKPSGQIVYSTCTFSKMEDEDVIQYALKQADDLVVDEIEKLPGFSDGITPDCRNAVRLYPFKLDVEGHFACRLTRRDGKREVYDKLNQDKECVIIDSIKEFFNLVNKRWANGYFKIINNRIYYIKDNSIDLTKIRTISSGLLVGILKNNRFEPSTALALSLKKEQFANVLDLSANDPRVIKYLKGETINIAREKLEDGYVLVCVDGYSLGFGKNSGGVLKNKYEVNYRWQ
ncbi:MAG: RsmB/NOP family class I SAM-dependent RNA methyltransferase [Erysipelotrichaceae bacterium]